MTRSAAGIQRRYVSLKDGQIHLRSLDGEGMPVILLHQTASSSAMFETLMQRLPGGAPSFALDTPGFGGSFDPPAPPSLDDYAAWILQALDALGIDRCDVIGHHTGGCIGVLLAASFPRRIRSLVVIGPVYMTLQEREAYRGRSAPFVPGWDKLYIEQTWNNLEKLGSGDNLALHHRELIDPAKVHPINFEGRFFRCRGPLNTAPGPQRRPVICQAGGSNAGMTFAAVQAETIIAVVRYTQEAQQFRHSMDRRLVAAGRQPGDVKTFFSVSIVLREDGKEAKDRRVRLDQAARNNIEHRLFEMSFSSRIDFSKFDLDAPLPELSTNASKSLAAKLNNSRKTLHELASRPNGNGIAFTGTPASVAVQMGEAMEEIGGDGFLLYETPTRRLISEITDGLAPELEKRNLIRSHYAYPTFRQNLQSF